MTTDFRSLCAELVEIDRRTKIGKAEWDVLQSVQFSNQGQALDGYSALAAFRNVANRARAALAEQPSLKEQALALVSHDFSDQPCLSEEGYAIIRRALEQLPND